MAAIKPNLTEVTITVNGKVHHDLIPSDLLLVDYLRQYKALTGTKKGCGSAECGACTVILDGRAVYSCVLLAVQADGLCVETIEGVSDGDDLHPIQEAYLDAGAVQCGFCTPGFIMSTKALLDKNPEPEECEIKEAIGGNLCRCTGYQQILDAVHLSVDMLKKEGEQV